MAYGLKACSCHPLKWIITQTAQECLELSSPLFLFLFFFLSHLEWVKGHLVSMLHYMVNLKPLLVISPHITLFWAYEKVSVTWILKIWVNLHGKTKQNKTKQNKKQKKRPKCHIIGTLITGNTLLSNLSIMLYNCICREKNVTTTYRPYRALLASGYLLPLFTPNRDRHVSVRKKLNNTNMKFFTEW